MTYESGHGRGQEKRISPKGIIPHYKSVFMHILLKIAFNRLKGFVKILLGRLGLKQWKKALMV